MLSSQNSFSSEICSTRVSSQRWQQLCWLVVAAAVAAAVLTCSCGGRYASLQLRRRRRQLCWLAVAAAAGMLACSCGGGGGSCAGL